MVLSFLHIDFPSLLKLKSGEFVFYKHYPSSHQLTPYPPYPPQIAHLTFTVVTPGAPADTPPVPNRF